ncbi:MAG: hypothetical protein HYY50_00925 [Candidatus Kerfeldbacteria bacterium]|nr:hypothetical protein [Candidatus Kerfeldbacteria bacterium]
MEKTDFGRKGNNWIESLREWILTAHHAEKLASSIDFDEIKSLVEKIGTNRRLLAKKVGWDWSGEWRIVAENQNKIPPARERSERVPSSENSQCLTWSGLVDDVRTMILSDGHPLFRLICSINSSKSLREFVQQAA